MLCSNFDSCCNAWNYYFGNLNSHSLNEVYKSKYVIIANDKFFNFFSYNLDKDKELIRLLNSEVKLNKYLQSIYKKILINFKHKKVLGIHFRGTSYKIIKSFVWINSIIL